METSAPKAAALSKRSGRVPGVNSQDDGVDPAGQAAYRLGDEYLGPGDLHHVQDEGNAEGGGGLG